MSRAARMILSLVRGSRIDGLSGAATRQTKAKMLQYRHREWLCRPLPHREELVPGLSITSRQ